MDTEQRNRLIKQKIDQGLSLGEVQKLLLDEHGISMTYLDLRLLASELQVNWTKQDDKKKKKDVAAATPKAGLTAPEDSAVVGTKVTISKVTRPDAALNGTVEFASGAKAQWFVDQMGRLALSPEAGSSKPTEEDIQEFQLELQRQVRGQGY